MSHSAEEGQNMVFNGEGEVGEMLGLEGGGMTIFA
jgi:hypothetical protein